MPWFAIISILLLVVFSWLVLRDDLAKALAPVATCSSAGGRVTALALACAFCVGVLVPHAGLGFFDQVRDVLTVAASALLAILLLSLIFGGTSAAFALCGAILGRGAYLDGPGPMLWIIPLEWISACILALVLGYILNSLLSRPSKKHLFREMHIWGVCILAASILFSAAAGFNLSPLFDSLVPLSGAWMLPAAVIAVLLASRGSYLTGRTMNFAENGFDASPAAALSMTVSASTVLLLFGFGVFRGEPVPLSPLVLLLSAALGCRLSRGHAQISGEPVSSLLASLLLCPAAAGLQAYFGLSGIAVALLAVLLVLFTKNRQSHENSAAQLRLRTEEMNEAAHRMNEMQIRAMQQENTHLQNLLSLRRSQVVDDAEKITEHQRFIGELYDDVGAIQAAEEADRDDLLRALRAKIHLRLNHGEGLESFYAKAETLHKDFNARLMAKYPQLTPQERRLATLLRLEFPTKYMANLLGISEKSVEVERHRIRKKLGLTRKDRLTDFIKNI